jgi:hypothetical protein
MRTHTRLSYVAGSLVIAILSAAVAEGGEKFVAIWKAEGEYGSRMVLRLLKPLPADPSEGWLNTPESHDADGDFQASRRKPARFQVKRGPVVFQPEKRGGYPAARYALRDGVLTVCMLSFTPGGFDGRAGIPVKVDYSLCAVMHKVEK